MCKYLGPSGITIVTLEKADARRKFHKELQKTIIRSLIETL